MGKKSGIAVGLNKGFVTVELSEKQQRKRPIHRRGILGKKVGLVRDIIKEICGPSPYEVRILELLKTHGAKDRKKAMKFAKKRLGTQRRGKKKVESLENYLQHLKEKK